MKHLAAPGKMLVSNGPVELTISAYKNKKGSNELAEIGANFIDVLLEQLSGYYEYLKKPYREVELDDKAPEIVKRMYESTEAFQEKDFTPMAAVASAIAGAVADKIFAAGADKVIVNNGGDIAVRLAKGEMTRVGIAPSLNEQNPSHYLDLSGPNKIKGISTSGFGGRSFTKGIASAAVAFSYKNELSDVAATLIGNHTITSDAPVEKKLAEELYAETDIIGQEVVASIGKLDDDIKKRALINGLKKAKKLKKKGLILGAAIFVKEYFGMVPQNIITSIE